MAARDYDELAERSNQQRRAPQPDFAPPEEWKKEPPPRRGPNGHAHEPATHRARDADEQHAHGSAEMAPKASKPRAMPERNPLDWRALEPQGLPERQWAICDWLGMGHVTLFAGAPGSGKTLVAQAIGSCLALGREYLGRVPAERRVLMWACEDDHDELWRRQAAIAKWLGVPLSDFDNRLVIHSYDGRDVTLAGLVNQRFISTPMLTELREQIGDYKADVVLLDNLARLYAGNENDRYQVTKFNAMLTAAAAPTKSAVGLLGHPGKAEGAEYSGSTAWEGSVRARLYLGHKLPDVKKGDDEEEDADDENVRFLCRRKANYSARDWRRLQFRDGVMVPERSGPKAPGTTVGKADTDFARDIVAHAVRKLAEMTNYGVSSTSSPNYLPKLASRYKLLGQLTKKDFAAAMRSMQSDGVLIMGVVGKYANRSNRSALMLAEPKGLCTSERTNDAQVFK